MNTDYFKNRRTIRSYSDQDVDDISLRSMIEAASHAPSTGNMQLYSVIVSRDAEHKNVLAPFHFNQKMVTDAPVVLTFCADFNRFIKWCKVSNATPGYDNFQSFVSALLDVTIFAEQFNTIAEMNGLGCCYIGTTTYNAPDIAKALNLPKMVIPVVTITVGYPLKEETVPFEMRLPIDSIMHIEKYNNYTDDDIKSMYAPKEALESNKNFVNINNKETLAQVFTEIRYNKKNNEIFSKIYQDFIIQQGFKFPY